ncbi:lysine transporter LysE [Kitasatospora sp. NPDC059571]|uniref:lysine transporter LysE n=1 Tax=Kitasatospora sp. NPDC059571 TaxID=3346871 RepID=UPI0036926B5B
MIGSLVSTAAAGAAAGLGVAMPLGAVGVLLLQEGGRGLRLGAAAAAAVASVDLLYAAVAVLVGPRLVGLLGGGEGWVRLCAGLVLAVIAVRGLLGLRGMGATGGGPARPVAEGGSETGAAAGGGSARRSFGRFALLTLVNPTTALYFTALTAARGGTTVRAVDAAVFAGAVFVASLAWQQVLAAAGALAGARLTVRARRTTYALGYGLVLFFAVRLAWPTG